MFELLLSNFAMHIQLDEREQALVLAQFKQATIKKNEILLAAGDVCKNIYFVNAGCLRLFYADKNGDQHNLLFYPENWWAADLASFSAQKPANYNIDALEQSEVFALSWQALEKLYTEVPKLERFFRILTQNGFALYQRRVTANQSQTAEERYARFHKQYPGLEQRIAQKHIAAYLGITPVFLSMIRRNK